MSLRLEKVDADTATSFAAWRKEYPGHGTLSLVKDLDTGAPMLKFQPDSGSDERKQPPAELYRIEM